MRKYLLAGALAVTMAAGSALLSTTAFATSWGTLWGAGTGPQLLSEFAEADWPSWGGGLSAAIASNSTSAPGGDVLASLQDAGLALSPASRATISDAVLTIYSNGGTPADVEAYFSSLPIEPVE